jgi:signal transduction histidine kinase
VSDSGPGITDEDRPFVFDRFWRSASARALPGSGLGLSIVAQVVAELQGTVTVDATRTRRGPLHDHPAERAGRIGVSRVNFCRFS